MQISMQQIQEHNNNNSIIHIHDIKPYDVLCGRGSMCFGHIGNHRFRMLIAEYAETYQMASTKKLKMQAVLLIVDIVIARGGRFLVKKNSSDANGIITTTTTTTCYWVDGGRRQGKKKTGHAFRDALRGRVKCIARMRAENAQHVAMLNDGADSSSRGVAVSVPPSSTITSTNDDERNKYCWVDEDMMQHNNDDDDYAPMPISTYAAGIPSAAAAATIEHRNTEASKEEWRRNASINATTASDLNNFFLMNGGHL